MVNHVHHVDFVAQGLCVPIVEVLDFDTGISSVQNLFRDIQGRTADPDPGTVSHVGDARTGAPAPNLPA